MATSRKQRTRTSCGQVVWTGPRRCTVRFEKQDYHCSLKKHIADHQQTMLTVGDMVEFITTGEGTGRVESVLPRTTSLSRRDPGNRRRTRVIAANMDAVIIVASAREPSIRPRLIDRFLAAVAAGGAVPLICVNKADLVESAEELGAIEDMLEPYRDMGIAVCLVSAHTGAGLAELSQLMEGGTSAFVGHSGVGKSSLLNRLGAREIAATGAVSKGRGTGTHTTSASQLYELPGAIRIIDTPGIRELSLDDASEASIKIAFPEIERLSSACRLRDCTHTHEPDCAVKEAVERGEISALRYSSYRRLHDGSDETEEASHRRTAEAPEWTCGHCRRTVGAAAPGTENRNHCPYCLWSVHVDNRPGDRKAFCKGAMEPITVWVRDGEWVIIHRCTTCGSLHANRIAGDDNEALLLSLAVRPLASPPFSLEGVGRG